MEKLSTKAGIPYPTVKDILNSLKADNLIECEKIGAGVFYWSFPSKALQIVSIYIISLRLDSLKASFRYSILSLSFKISKRATIKPSEDANKLYLLDNSALKIGTTRENALTLSLIS